MATTATIAPPLSRFLRSERYIASGQRSLLLLGAACHALVPTRETPDGGLRPARLDQRRSAAAGAARAPAAAAVAGPAALACDFPLFRRVHRRKAALRTTTLRSGHAVLLMG